MTESPEGIANADQIYALPGLDGIFVGPNDLKTQMTKTLPGGRKPTPEEFESAVDQVLAAGKRTGCPVGIHTFSIEECKARIAQGHQFMAYLSDVGILNAESAKAVQALGIIRGSTSASGEGNSGVGGLGVY